MSAPAASAARAALRPETPSDASEATPPAVRAVDPPDGAEQVFFDGPILLRLSHRLDPKSVSAESVRLEDPAGRIPIRMRSSPDGRLLLCIPEVPLAPGLVHFVVAAGLRDHRGRELPRHVSRFVPGGVGWRDLAE